MLQKIRRMCREIKTFNFILENMQLQITFNLIEKLRKSEEEMRYPKLTFILIKLFFLHSDNYSIS